jgi:hypothetical protein
MFRRNKIILAHACSAGGTNRGNMPTTYQSPGRGDIIIEIVC